MNINHHHFVFKDALDCDRAPKQTMMHSVDDCPLRLPGGMRELNRLTPRLRTQADAILNETYKQYLCSFAKNTLSHLQRCSMIPTLGNASIVEVK